MVDDHDEYEMRERKFRNKSNGCGFVDPGGSFANTRCQVGRTNHNAPSLDPGGMRTQGCTGTFVRVLVDTVRNGLCVYSDGFIDPYIG